MTTVSRRTQFERHGMSHTPEYSAWRNMVGRCTPGSRRYEVHREYYGDRGITVCDQWRASFVNFLADVGPRPSDQHSLDRIDNDKGYEPGNVRWATASEQAQNRRPRRSKK